MSPCAGKCQHLCDCRHRHGRRARRSGLIAQEPIYPFLGVAPLPAPNRRAAYAGATRHFENGQTIGRVQHNAGALYVLERSASIPDDLAAKRARSSAVTITDTV
jgi:hypothetical protein